MKAYYGSKISPNKTATTEGFLICQNVPIARTGWQEYLASELGLEGNGKIQVHRSEEEVFDPATIASFEGKSITDEHPSSWIVPDNVSSYEKGHVQNVRRGTGDESDLLLADLYVKNPILISEIESGKREVSCGYDCIYEPIDGQEGKYEQKQIRGNHVAVVQAGRAGTRVAIKDNKPERRERKVARGKITKEILAAMGFKQFVQDAEPEEIAEATKAMSDEESKEKEIPTKDEGGMDQIMEALSNILDRLEALEKSDKAVHENMQPEDELTKLENELTGDVEGEEYETIEAEEMDGVMEATTVPIAGEEEKPKNPIPGADRKTVLDTIAALKPVIAAIQDPVARKKASDSMAKMLRNTVSAPAADSTNRYGEIVVNATNRVKAGIKDGKPVDDMEYGKDIAKKYNPHYKNR